MDLADAVLSGNRLALARLLTRIENGTLEGRQALQILFKHTGGAHLVGVTGAPGTGKSSLVNRLAFYFRHPPAGCSARRVGVIAVDPSSPFTGGAILGDRVRMRDLAGDPDVFIRSMASRGALGGLAAATSGLVQGLDAAGFEIIFIETVGAGQAEVDIARLAHTTVVVEAPGLGDDIQAIKAGILEIADVLVVNKADRPGVENTERALRNMLQLAQPTPAATWHHGVMETVPSSTSLAQDEMPGWQVPLIRTVAIENMGIAALGEAILEHRSYLESSGNWRRRDRARLQTELDSLLQAALVSRWRQKLPEQHYREILDEVVARQLSPWQAVDSLLDGGMR